MNTQISLWQSHAPAAATDLAVTDAPPNLYTIGYEGRTLDEFIEQLEAAGVQCVIDVRAIAASRKMGFAKTKLRIRLDAHGIEYVHLPRAGNPFRKDKDVQRALRAYAEHLREHPNIVEAVRALARQTPPAALLCFEADVKTCHRSVLWTAVTNGALEPDCDRHL